MVMTNTKKKLLIIEDTQTDAELLVHRLRQNKFDFEYYIVESLRQVQEHLDKQDVGLIISDFNLPGFDGIEALKMVKKYDRMIPFILLSGSINQQQETDILEQGANEVIMKSHLNRLPFAVKRVLYEVEDRKNLKETSEKLEESLQQMQVLLQEVHHRVKNNLQIISGLLELRKMEPESESVNSIINDLLVKIRSIAKVHEMLYKNMDVKNISLGELIEDLSTYTLRITGVDQTRYNVNAKVESIDLNVNQAVPCGMIISELVHNAVQHAFNGEKEYEINITGRQQDEKVVISVADNGCGLPDGFSFEKGSGGMGSTIVSTLFKQLDADYHIQNDQGSAITFEFIKKDTKGIHSNF